MAHGEARPAVEVWGRRRRPRTPVPRGGMRGRRVARTGPRCPPADVLRVRPRRPAKRGPMSGPHVPVAAAGTGRAG
ncbi:hypothetical protein HBB16_12230 [Pseudonocardia sp. MCCB 268]|nr:hypothetical protein [Pseudonocardia cytotoxica]